MTHPMPLTWALTSLKSEIRQLRAELAAESNLLTKRQRHLERLEQIADQIESGIYHEQVCQSEPIVGECAISTEGPGH